MKESVTLAILAGGRGERMGRAKGELRVGDKPILTYLLERMRWAGPTMVVTAPGRERPPGVEGFDREVVDPVEGMGPVRGVVTALENCATELLVVTSVDMPGVGREQVEWLVERIGEAPDAAGVMIRRGETIEPMPGVFRCSRARRPCYEELQGRRSLRALADREEFVVLPSPAEWGEQVWTNLNEPGDLVAFDKSIRR